jgi:small-conductance mechanosensitive channel/CRP-like cAMP-binding protein
MLDDYPVTERFLIGAGIAPVVYILAVGIGRFLKRRIGVQLGLLYQLLCIVLALYTPVAILYRGTSGYLYEFGRALLGASIVLGSFFIVAICKRFLWEGYFEKRKATHIPHFVREVAALILFIVAVIIVMDAIYNLSIKGILAGSGVAAIILGLAMQDLLGSIIAGVALEVGRPFKVGDWLHVEGDYAQVTELNWRSVRLRTNDDILLDIPNNEIVKHKITNLTHPVARYAVRLQIGVDYDVPPNIVKDICVRAAENAAHVLKQPGPKAFLRDFGDSAIVYEVKFYMQNHRRYNDTMDAVRTNIWYEFKRAGIRIPFPIRTLQIERSSRRADSEPATAAARALRRQAIFQCLTEKQLEKLTSSSRPQRFGRLERIITQGMNGTSMFVLVEGEAEVLVSDAGDNEALVATLRTGDCFGEMSLLTGASRSATVVARTDCEVLEIEKEDLGVLLADNPELMKALSDLLAQRQIETEGVLASAQRSEILTQKQQKYRESFIAKVSSYFGL